MSTIETRIAQGLHYVDAVTGGVVPPIQPSTTFAATPTTRCAPG
ncbi:MAG: hypothetical protein U5K76_04005 [Woeseiaceae bacterium]|nr:hypothetical protein [Woeseiaceae bacterium]